MDYRKRNTELPIKALNGRLSRLKEREVRRPPPPAPVLLSTTTSKHSDPSSTSLSQTLAMTLFLPLEGSSPLPSSPSFLAQVSDSSVQVQRVIKSLLKAKRIAVVCGMSLRLECVTLTYQNLYPCLERCWNFCQGWHPRFSLLRWAIPKSQER